MNKNDTFNYFKNITTVKQLDDEIEQISMLSDFEIVKLAYFHYSKNFLEIAYNLLYFCVNNKTVVESYYGLLGCIVYSMNKYDEAYNFFIEGEKLDDVISINGLGVYHCNRKEYDEMIKYLTDERMKEQVVGFINITNYWLDHENRGDALIALTMAYKNLTNMVQNNDNTFSIKYLMQKNVANLKLIDSYFIECYYYLDMEATCIEYFEKRRLTNKIDDDCYYYIAESYIFLAKTKTEYFAKSMKYYEEGAHRKCMKCIDVMIRHCDTKNDEENLIMWLNKKNDMQTKCEILGRYYYDHKKYDDALYFFYEGYSKYKNMTCFLMYITARRICKIIDIDHFSENIKKYFNEGDSSNIEKNKELIVSIFSSLFDELKNQQKLRPIIEFYYIVSLHLDENNIVDCMSDKLFKIIKSYVKIYESNKHKLVNTNMMKEYIENMNKKHSNIKNKVSILKNILLKKIEN